jgi:hypothetical protein
MSEILERGLRLSGDQQRLTDLEANDRQMAAEDGEQQHQLPDVEELRRQGLL